ncbi:MAG: aminotransferase class V-fold PLP-dependent enzyme [Candidatus Micrarchaeota archaeon]
MTLLLTPGPVPLTDRISKAQTNEMITHRCPQFSELYGDLAGRLREYLNADEAYVITGSGALGLETLVLNLCMKGDKVVCFPNGDFGEKLVLTVNVHAKADSQGIEDGKGWDLERAKAAIDTSDAQVLAMVQNETSYGIMNHVDGICKYAKSKGMITIIDGISAWPGTKMDMKKYSIDGFVTGSQKGTGAPPGMALLGLSQEAVERFSSREYVPSYYMDLRRHKKRFEKDRQTPNTPAISLFYALQKAFDAIDEGGGLQACIKRHEDAARHVRSRLKEMGFGMIAERGFESNTVTGFYCKSGEEASMIRKGLLEEYDIRIVGSRGAFKETGLRIAHMGNFRMEDLDRALGCIDKLRAHD